MKPLEIKIYVPQIEGKEAYVINVANKLTRIFRGCTIYNGCLGLWLNPKTSKIEYDKVSVIEILTSENIFNNHKKAFSLILALIKEDLNQSCVAFSINHEISLW